MHKITLLPKWVLPSTMPNVYDTESGTCIEMTSKVYGAMRKLQEEYNLFVDEINKCITEFTESVNKDQEEFEVRITKIIHDYIKTLDLKIAHQDRVIEESIVYISQNLSEGITTVINEMVENGQLDEAIVNAVGNIGDRITLLENQNLDNRVTSLENANLTNQSDIEGINRTLGYLNSRVASLEGKNIIYLYDGETETLNIQLGGSV